MKKRVILFSMLLSMLMVLSMGVLVAQAAEKETITVNFVINNPEDFWITPVKSNQKSEGLKTETVLCSVGYGDNRSEKKELFLSPNANMLTAKFTCEKGKLLSILTATCVAPGGYNGFAPSGTGHFRDIPNNGQTITVTLSVPHSKVSPPPAANVTVTKK